MAGLRGGAEAFGAVYERHGPAVMRYLIRRLGPDVGEDAAHDVFVRAFRLRAGYDAALGSVAGWLFGIALNVASEHRRAEGRRLRALERLAGATPRSSPDAPAGLDLSPALARALRRLPAKEREALLLVVWGELSYAEVAGALDIPVGTVRSRISRARTTLHDAAAPQRRPAPAITNGDAHV
ncbi:RNA polymerase sigma factor [Patulibacter sp. NPDC049589]|uniref:RNA polymerase sigma factor n=1 Tax=Patulibacter sp. NPDC049589 TaxID=3154731 RepID=UPI00343BFFC3